MTDPSSSVKLHDERVLLLDLRFDDDLSKYCTEL